MRSPHDYLNRLRRDADGFALNGAFVSGSASACRTERCVRYAKLIAGVILVLVATLATVDAVGDAICHFRSCDRISAEVRSWLEPHVCSGGVPKTAIASPLALSIWAAAILSLCFRTRARPIRKRRA